MIYKFIFISDEEAEFMREISIDSEASFLDLHQAILDAIASSVHINNGPNEKTSIIPAKINQIA